MFLFATTSCSHKQIAGEFIFREQQLYLKQKHEFDFSNAQAVKNQIQKLGPLNKYDVQETFVRLLVAFTVLKRSLTSNEIQTLPNSSTKVTLSSFCASPNKAIPKNNEIFKWITGSSKIPLAKSVISYFSQSESKEQKTTQELLWNLANGTYYEDYPEKLRTILNRISPTARLTLPSRMKDRISRQVIPENVRELVGLAEGAYHSFEDFHAYVSRNNSKESLPLNYLASKIPNTEILAITSSNGYESQVIDFHNLSDKKLLIKLEDFFLDPARADVQPIILSSVIPQIDEIQKILEEYALKLLGYLGSKYPTLNSSEKELVKQNGIEAAIVFYNAMVAERNGEKFFPDSSINGRSDAFRHFVWAGLMVRDIGDAKARKYLEAHETSPGQSTEEREMDTYNNERGVGAGVEMNKNNGFENQELFDRAIKEIRERKLRILKD